MMLITAVVIPARVPLIRHALGLFGAHGVTVSRVFVWRAPDSFVQTCRGIERGVPMDPRTRLDVLTSNADYPDLLHVIFRAAGGGDLEIRVARVDHAVRIRTGEVDLDVL